jgi:hypothetical protein
MHQFQIDEASTQVATTLYEMMSVREVAVAVPAGSQFPLTDHEARPIDFGVCELTPMEQIMVAELQADAARYVSIDTNGNGACGLHAPFGALVTAACCERSPEIQTFNVTKFVSVHKCTPRDFGPNWLGLRHCESSRFWELLAPSLRAATIDEMQKQITTDEQVDEARRRLHGWDLSRRLDLS